MPKPRGPHPDPSRDRTGEGWRPQPTPPGEVVDWSPPEGLSENAQRVWHRLVDHLGDTGAVMPSDKWMLGELCEAFALAVRFRMELERSTDLTSQEAKRARSGYIDMMNLVDKLAGQFGLTPTARAKLGIGKRASEAGFMAFIQQTGIVEDGDGDQG